jgi:hypothetical protein
MGLPGCTAGLWSGLWGEVDSSGMLTRELVGLVLKPLALSCKFQDGGVMLTSRKSPNEPLFFVHHGEIFRDHHDGARVSIAHVKH